MAVGPKWDIDEPRAWLSRAVLVVLLSGVAAWASPAAAGAADTSLPIDEPGTLADAQRLFYNAHYAEAAALALALQRDDGDALPRLELRSSALLFQIRALLEGRRRNKEEALKACATCPGLIAEFLDDIRRGQALARASLRADPTSEHALFYLGKLDLNYVWLQLGPLGKKTGWDEYWEARRSLDAVLKRNPEHVRAKVSRAWIDYIVDTRMPWGTRWLLGGGNRKQALIDVRRAAEMESDFFTHAEAEFALWDMLVRERELAPAKDAAQRLAHAFPDNREVATFLESSETPPRR
ncbi:MAG: hypothetical protein U0Q12_13780 [Vicinamibacterales bacterium]